MNCRCIISGLALWSAISAVSGVAAPRTLPDTEPFVIGVYSAEPWTDENFAMLKAAGVSYVHSYRAWNEEAPLRLLDAAQRNGLKVMYDLGAHRVIRKEKHADWRAVMTRRLQTLNGHPALGMVYLWDEPTTEAMPDVTELRRLAALGTSVPSTLVIHWRTNWENTRGASDIWMADWYPIRGHQFPSESPLDELSRFVGTACRMKLPGTEFIPVLQMCDFRCFARDVAPARLAKLRYPNAVELRFMMFGCVSYGVRGLFFFSEHHAHLDTPEGRAYFNTVFRPLTLELRELEKWIPELWKPTGQCYDFNDNHRVVCAYFERASGKYLVLGNASAEARHLVLPMTAVPHTPRDGQLKPWGGTAAKPAVLVAGKLTVTAAPWEVFVWRIE